MFSNDKEIFFLQAHDELTEQRRNGSGFYNVYEISSRPLDIFDFYSCLA